MSEAVTIDTIKNILTKNVNKEYSLSREEAIAIMNLPEDDMPLLMEMAGSLRKKYKGNHVSIHLLTNARSGKLFSKIVLIVPSLAVQKQKLKNING